MIYQNAIQFKFHHLRFFGHLDQTAITSQCCGYCTLTTSRPEEIGWTPMNHLVENKIIYKDILV